MSEIIQTFLALRGLQREEQISHFYVSLQFQINLESYRSNIIDTSVQIILYKQPILHVIK